MNDEDLRSALKRSDPSRRHRPLDEARVIRVVAAAERDLPTTADATPPRRRPRWVLAGAGSVGAAAVAAATAVALFATPATQSPLPPLAETPPSLGSAVCAPATLDSLRANDTAYEAVVTDADDLTVTVQVTVIYRGEPGDVVTFPQLQEEGNSTPMNVFVTGRAYLFASVGGDISQCDSGSATPQLTDLYQAAFANLP